MPIRGCRFLNDLDVSGCIFKENVRHSTYHLKVYQICNNMGKKITCTEVRKSNGYACGKYKCVKLISGF